MIHLPPSYNSIKFIKESQMLGFPNFFLCFTPRPIASQIFLSLPILEVPYNFDLWDREPNASVMLFKKGLKIQNYKLVISHELINIFE